MIDYPTVLLEKRCAAGGFVMRGIVYSEVDPSQRGSLSDGLDVLGWLIALRLVAIAVSVTTAKVVNEAGVRAPCLHIAPGA